MAADDPPLVRRAVLRRLTLPACATATLWLGGCATSAPPGTAAAEWHDVPLPGKRRTEYRWESREGRRELVARADRSSSMFRRRVDASPATWSEIEFAWWVQSLPAQGDVSDADAADAAARVLLAFGGDHTKLSTRNQIQFELARALTGEMPPYATLAYVWDAKAPVDSMVIHPRSDRVRKVVVESGGGALRQWCHYRRSVADDYRRAFGEAPGPLLAMAVMTDGDNTGSILYTRYRDIRLR
jgi:hypothetical protein